MGARVCLCHAGEWLRVVRVSGCLAQRQTWLSTWSLPSLYRIASSLSEDIVRGLRERETESDEEREWAEKSDGGQRVIEQGAPEDSGIQRRSFSCAHKHVVNSVQTAKSGV